jgi:hypothetical protein
MSRDYPRIAEYSLYRRALLHTSKVCARKSLQDCSMVSSSLQRTLWGFTASVSIAPTQKPRLVPCGFGHRSFPHTIPRFCHRSFTKHPSGLPSQLPRTAGWYAKTRLYLILCQAIPIKAHGCTVFMGGRSMNRSWDLGMITIHKLPASHRTKPWTVGITLTNSIPVTPNPILHTNRINVTMTATRVT